MRIEFFGKSDKGKVRKGNEDYFINAKISDDEYLFVVADGMGGHRAGDVASRLGTLSFVKEYKRLRRKNIPITEAMNQSISCANVAILDKATLDPQKKGMGTTFSAIAISEMKAYIVHVGDSRIYLVRNDHLIQLTTDHTFVGKMLEEGRITESEARDHPQKNILYMSMGARKAFDPQIDKTIDLQVDDVFLMCSDGLNNMVDDQVIKEYLLSYSTQECVEQLIKLANENGGLDNITVQIVRIEKTRDPDKTEPILVIPPMKKKTLNIIQKFIGNKNPMEEP